MTVLRFLQVFYFLALGFFGLCLLSGPPMGESGIHMWDRVFVGSGVYCLVVGPVSWVFYEVDRRRGGRRYGRRGRGVGRD